MSEVRPWLRSYVTVARFKTLSPLTLVDCSATMAGRRWLVIDGETEANREVSAWASIDAAFSTPVVPNESTADYIPTQILAEAFRKHGFDGIVYKSMISKGTNVALFNTSVADVTSRFLYEVDSISFGFRKHAESTPITQESLQELLNAPMQH